MTKRVCIVGLALACSLWGCAPAPDDSGGNAREVTNEMPKSDPKTEALPSPLEGYTPKAGNPPGAPKK